MRHYTRQYSKATKDAADSGNWFAKKPYGVKPIIDFALDAFFTRVYRHNVIEAINFQLYFDLSLHIPRFTARLYASIFGAFSVTVGDFLLLCG